MIFGHDPESFIALRKDFCGHFPEFRSIHLRTEQASSRQFQQTGLHQTGSSVGKGIYLETANGDMVRAQQASDGAVLFLGFLALFHVPEPPMVLLIEEPETGVYPKRLDQIIRILRNMSSRMNARRLPQIIFTTHSPYVLTSFKPEEVTLMSRRGSAAIARPFRDAPHIERALRVTGNSTWESCGTTSTSRSCFRMPDAILVLEICGEGKTDVGTIPSPGKSPTMLEMPTEGVVPILVHQLCGRPTTMRVIRRAFSHLIGKGKGLWQKVKFAKQTAYYNKSAGAVFVMDSEGKHAERIKELIKGRDDGYAEFPMAVGVAHPCIEAWLLADASAIYGL